MTPWLEHRTNKLFTSISGLLVHQAYWCIIGNEGEGRPPNSIQMKEDSEDSARCITRQHRLPHRPARRHARPTGLCAGRAGPNRSPRQSPPGHLTEKCRSGPVPSPVLTGHPGAHRPPRRGTPDPLTENGRSGPAPSPVLTGPPGACRPARRSCMTEDSLRPVPRSVHAR